MLLTLEEQKESLYQAARSLGVEIGKDAVEWRDETFDSGGLTIHYMDWGTRGKQPLLLLHGGMQTAHSWDIVSVAMKQRYHVVAMDMRGHGDSGWSDEGDYGFPTHANDVRALVERLGWERYALVGLSLGGLTAMTLTALHSPPLDALVIVDVGPELNTKGVGRIAEFGKSAGGLKSFDDFIEQSMKYNPRREREQLRYSLTHNLKQLEDGTWSWKYDRRVAGGGAKSVRDRMPRDFAKMWDGLKQIACPTLVVRGGDSEVFEEKTGKRMADVIADCRFVTVPDAGHTVPGDNPAGFLAELQSFLSDKGLP